MFIKGPTRKEFKYVCPEATVPRVKISVSLFSLLLALALLPVEASDETFGAITRTSGVTYAPLFLLIQGNGRVLPFENGQMLPVGRDFELSAFPDRGYEFAYWSPVDVFTDTEVIYDSNGVPLPPRISVTISPIPKQIPRPSLRFTMQPVEVIVDIPGVRTLTRGEGWQATFVQRR